MTTTTAPEAAEAPPASQAARRAVLHRMVMPGHTCPYGLKSLDLLKRKGFTVEDHPLRTREETDAFKAAHDVKTTPQTFIDGKRIGGYDDLRRYFGERVQEADRLAHRADLPIAARTSGSLERVASCITGITGRCDAQRRARSSSAASITGVGGSRRHWRSRP